MITSEYLSVRLIDEHQVSQDTTTNTRNRIIIFASVRIFGKVKQKSYIICETYQVY